MILLQKKETIGPPPWKTWEMVATTQQEIKILWVINTLFCILVAFWAKLLRTA